MGSRAKPRPSGTAVGYALVVLGSLVVAGSIMPGTLVDSWPEIVQEFRSGATLAIQHTAFATGLERCVTFLPLGWLIFLERARRERHCPHLVSCLATSRFVSFAQGVIRDRHARLSDFVPAVAFGCAGATLAWGETIASTPSVPAHSALVLGNLAVMVFVVSAIRATELGGWVCPFGRSLLVAALVW
jgi:hypothetical protein